MRLCPSIFTRAQYALGLCVCVRLYVCVFVNTLVYVSPLKIRHKSALCSFFTESIVLWRRFLCWQALLERLIHGFLKLRVLVRAFYGIVGVSPYLHIDVLTQSHMYRTPESLLAISGCRPGHARAMPGLAWLAEIMCERNVYNVHFSRINRLVVTRVIFEHQEHVRPSRWARFSLRRTSRELK